MKKEELKKTKILNKILKEPNSEIVRNSDLENAVLMAVFQKISLEDTIFFLNRPKSKKKKKKIEEYYNNAVILLNLKNC